jgi:hypothetical protein
VQTVVCINEETLQGHRMQGSQQPGNDTPLPLLAAESAGTVNTRNSLPHARRQPSPSRPSDGPQAVTIDKGTESKHNGPQAQLVRSLTAINPVLMTSCAAIYGF